MDLQNLNTLLKFKYKNKAKQSIAFVGQSGSGKTTIANILAFFKPSKGEILIDVIKQVKLIKTLGGIKLIRFSRNYNI